MLGGKGVSASIDGSPAITFANNEGWHDDVSDGPVTADGRAGRNAAGGRPGVGGRRAAQLRAAAQIGADHVGPDARRRDQGRPACRAPTGRRSPTTSCPLFERMAGLQWVNAGFAAGFGWEGAFDLTSPTQHSRGSAATARRTASSGASIYNSFRDFDVDAISPMPWPWLYGDAMNIPPAQTPRQNAALSATASSTMLRQWADGNFDADHDPAAPIAHDHRRGAARRAGRHADPGGAGFLPGRRLPSRLRDDVAGARGDPCTWRRSASATRPRPGSRRGRARSDHRRRHHPQRSPCSASAPGGSRAGWRCRGRPTPAAAGPATRPPTTPTSPPSGRRACRTRC